jgi:hypothetical protein
MDQYEAALARARAVNREIIRWAQSVGLLFLYDSDEDSFLLTIGSPASVVTLKADDVLWLRLHPESGVLLGLEVPHVSLFLAAHPELREHVAWFVERAKSAPGTYVPVEPRELFDATRALLGIVRIWLPDAEEPPEPPPLTPEEEAELAPLKLLNPRQWLADVRAGQAEREAWQAAGNPGMPAGWVRARDYLAQRGV